MSDLQDELLPDDRRFPKSVERGMAVFACITFGFWGWVALAHFFGGWMALKLIAGVVGLAVALNFWRRRIFSELIGVYSCPQCGGPDCDYDRCGPQVVREAKIKR
jgi:hypothetical protein